MITGDPSAHFTLDNMAQFVRVMEEYAGIKEPPPQAHLEDKVEIGKNHLRQVIVIPPEGQSMGSRTPLKMGSPGSGGTENFRITKRWDFLNGVGAETDDRTISDLEREGCKVYENQPFPLVPGIPRAGTPLQPTQVDPLKLTGADRLIKEGWTGKGETIAILGSGYDHPQYKLKVWADVIDSTPRPVDPVGHETHVAGVIHQFAPDADLMAIRMMRPDGQGADGQGQLFDIMDALDLVWKNKERFNIKVVNMSLAGLPDNLPDYKHPINQAIKLLHDAGVTVVAAAGNFGPNPVTIGAPGDAAAAITVGAALDHTTMSLFSSRGPTEDGLPKPDVVAAGEYIVSWNVPGSQLDKFVSMVERVRRMSDPELVQLLTRVPDVMKLFNLPEDILDRPSQEREKIIKNSLPAMYKPDPLHIALPGTSFACPEVAGIVLDLGQANPKLKPDDFKQILRETADPMGQEWQVYDQGAGFVNASKALTSAKEKAA
ncbi:MAG: S8 family serine peptidase [Armatimonadetes bacterium]|nr:S8 family serine peptidase [Armatimonadota bacterium]